MVRHAWVDRPIGWRFNILGVDGLRFLELTVFKEDDANCDHLLTGCQAFIRYNTCHFLIGFSPGSKRRFIFCAFHIYIYIYITLLLFHFSTFQLKHIVRALSSTLSESDPLNSYTHHLYNRRPSVTQTRWVLLFFTSPAFVLSFS